LLWQARLRRDPPAPPGGRRGVACAPCPLGAVGGEPTARGGLVPEISARWPDRAV